MLELFIVRHGETPGNVNKTYMGRTDMELTPEGLKQAEKVRDRLSGEKFTAVYCSPQKRTLQTAGIICGLDPITEQLQYLNTAEKTGAVQATDIISEEDLRERNFGIFDNLTYEEIKQRFPQEHDAWVKDWVNYRIPGGESAADVFKRVSAFISDLEKKHPYGKLLLITHKGWIMNAAAYLLGMPIEGLWHFHVDPGSVTRFEIRDGFRVMKQLNG